MLQPVIASAMQVKLMVGIIFFLVMVTDVPLPGVAGRQGTAWFWNVWSSVISFLKSSDWNFLLRR